MKIKKFNALINLFIICILLCITTSPSLIPKINALPQMGTLAFYPEFYDFGEIKEYEINTTIFQIWREGGCCALEYSLECNETWIDVFPTSGTSHGEMDDITVTVDANKLTPGHHRGNITIISNGGDGIFFVECIVNTVYWPDLECFGDLVWSDVEPGVNISGEIQVFNIGDPGSKLDWELISYPSSWGEWNFSMVEYHWQKPQESPKIINVTVVCPDEKKAEFNGNITIVNKYNSSDYCEIEVSLSTAKDLKSSGNSNVWFFLKNFVFTSSSAQYKWWDFFLARYSALPKV